MVEAVSPLADPGNPNGRWWYKPTGPQIDWAAKALYEDREAYIAERKKRGEKDPSIPPYLRFGIERQERAPKPGQR